MNPQPTKHKILIEFTPVKNRRFFKKIRHLVQNRPFQCQLRIKNVDTKNSPKGSITNLRMKSGEGGSIDHDLDEKLSFPELNPGQETTLLWPKTTSMITKGASWIECSVNPHDPAKTEFTTCQSDPICKTENEYKYGNKWGNGFTTRGTLEQQQATTNFMILILTLLVFLDGVWGLNTIVKFLINTIGWVFTNLGELLSALGN